MPITVVPKENAKDLKLQQIAPAAYLSEVAHSDAPAEEQITAGFYTQVDGEILEYTYGFDEIKYVIEVVGEFFVTDENGTNNVKAGEVVYIKSGTTVKFETKGGHATAFFVAKKKCGPP